MPSIRSRNTSAMATSLSGTPETEKASCTAPPPRPPQPTSAMRIWSLPAAWAERRPPRASSVPAANAVAPREAPARKLRRFTGGIIG